MYNSNISLFEDRDQIDITEVIDKMFHSTGLITNDS